MAGVLSHTDNTHRKQQYNCGEKLDSRKLTRATTAQIACILTGHFLSFVVAPAHCFSAIGVFSTNPWLYETFVFYILPTSGAKWNNHVKTTENYA